MYKPQNNLKAIRGFVGSNEPFGYDLLFLHTHFHDLNIEKYVRCDRVDAVGKTELMLNGGKVDTIEFAWCRNYQGVRP